jgi:putative multiple sugar transport system ATP-binding protein
MRGTPVDTRPCERAIAAGISYVTEDRKALGLILEEPIQATSASPTSPASRSAAC